ncbi:hypothetical protein [Armatimonas sp.]|uniref:hypothetical protein n=1 Tax=Armatimonas sp. TaxID=1872638 RepID=UPI0037524328
MITLTSAMGKDFATTLIHHTDRCDWNLFHLGLSWIEYCLNKGLPLRTFSEYTKGAGKSVG